LHLISREPDFEKSLRALKHIEKQKTGPHHQQLGDKGRAEERRSKKMAVYPRHVF
jgi:hypothetical protein